MIPYMPSVIGISGYPGHGKDTVAKAFGLYGDFVKYSLADPLYELVSFTFGVPVDKLRDRSYKDLPMLELGNKSPRQVLQIVGTDYMRSINDHVWIDKFLDYYHKVTPSTQIVVPDVRFRNEQAEIKKLGGITIGVIDPRKPPDSKVISHKSEHDVPYLVNSATYKIINDSTIENLLLKVKDIFEHQESLGPII